MDYIAQVKVNDADLGILWKPPFRIRITPALRAGDNRIEVKVTNVWANRLIGDEKLPDDREWIISQSKGDRGWRMKEWPSWYVENTPRTSNRITFTTWKYYDGSEEPPESGLIGPVKLYTVENVKLT